MVQEVKVMHFSFSPAVKTLRKPKNSRFILLAVVPPPLQSRGCPRTMAKWVWGTRGMESGEPSMSPGPLDSAQSRKHSPHLGRSQAWAGAGFNPEVSSLRTWVSRGRGGGRLWWAHKPDHEGGRGRTLPRTTARTLESDLALAQHVLGPPTPSVALLRAQG